MQDHVFQVSYISCPLSRGAVLTLYAAKNQSNFQHGSEHSIIYPPPTYILSLHAPFFPSWRIILQALPIHHLSFHFGFSKHPPCPIPPVPSWGCLFNLQSSRPSPPIPALSYRNTGFQSEGTHIYRLGPGHIGSRDQKLIFFPLGLTIQSYFFCFKLKCFFS